MNIKLCINNTPHYSEEDSESLATVKDALADASQMAYVRGHWIYADSGHNGQYLIVGAILPGAGDIAAYQLCGIIIQLEYLQLFLGACL